MKNNFDYYILHEKGYTFGDGNMRDLTPLQVNYIMKSREIENQEKIDRMNDNIDNDKSKTRKGIRKNINNNDKSKNKLKQKYKQRTQGG